MVFEEAYAIPFTRPPNKTPCCNEVLTDLRHVYTDPQRIVEPENSQVRPNIV